jgi:hypothetical protein
MERARAPARARAHTRVHCDLMIPCLLPPCCALCRAQEGLPQSIKNLVSPNKTAKMGKKDVLQYLRDKGVTIDDRLASSLGYWLQRQKSHQRELPSDAANTYTGIRLHAENNTKAKLKAEGVFTEHATYTIFHEVRVPEGKNVWINVGARSSNKRKQTDEQDPDAGAYLCVVFSTENLLLNAYRQQVSGMPGIMCVDYTHRLTYEGFNMCVIGTISPSQHFKQIGYALASDETQATHELIFGAIRKEVEAVVAERRACAAAAQPAAQSAAV